MTAKNSRRILGLSFTSPAMVAVMAMAHARMRAHLINNDVSRETVLGWLDTEARKDRVFIVQGVTNLRKMGAKAKEEHVVVHDVPELLSCFPDSIRIGDANEDSPGVWKSVPIDPDGLTKRLNWSQYSSPINPKAISEARASFVVALPSHSKKFEPVPAINALLAQVRERHRDELETGILEFLAGLTDRRRFSALRRRAVNQLREKDKPERANEFKVLFSSIQRWIEAEDEGRAVTGAYQLCARMKDMTAPVAASRVNANLEALLHLMTRIPPSRRQVFAGYKLAKEVA